MSAQLQGDTKAAADHYVAAGKLDPRSSRSTELLKGLRKRAPIGVLLAFILIRLISIPFRDGSGVVQAIGLGVVVGVPRVPLRRVATVERQARDVRRGTSGARPRPPVALTPLGLRTR